VFASSIHFLLSDGTTSLGALLYEGESRIGVGIKAWTKSYFTYRFGWGLGQTSKSALIEVKDPDDSRNEDMSATQISLSPEKQAWRLWDNEGAIIRVVRAVADRVSTFQSDEALCLALLLGIDARSIIAAKNKLKAREDLEKAQPDKFKSPEAQQERLKLEKEPMVAFLRLVDGSIPPGILLLPGPWQDDYGFRWAPKSFLNGPHNSSTLNIYSEWPHIYPIRLNNRVSTRSTILPTYQCALQEHHDHP
jgi:hypothetical protein